MNRQVGGGQSSNLFHHSRHSLAVIHDAARAAQLGQVTLSRLELFALHLELVVELFVEPTDLVTLSRGCQRE